MRVHRMSGMFAHVQASLPGKLYRLKVEWLPQHETRYVREDLECSHYMKNFDVGHIPLRCAQSVMPARRLPLCAARRLSYERAALNALE